MDNEQIIDIFIGQIATKVPVDDLEIIRTELLGYFKDYKIEPAVQLPDAVSNKVLPDILDTFIIAKQIEGLSNGSIEQYKYILSLFFKNVLKPINCITADDVRMFIFLKSQQSTVSKSYLNHIRIILNSFFEWCYNEDYIRKNPMANIAPIKGVKKQVKALTEKQLEICRMHYTELSFRDQTIFEFCYSTGCRASEVCNLKKEDIDFDSKTAVVFGKGSKYRTVYLNEKVILMLNEYFESRTDDSEYVFVKNRAPHDKLSVDGLEYMFGKLSKLVGFKIHPHMMRHTTATIALNRGMPLEEVQQLLGHRSPDTTMIYAAINNDNVKYHHQKYLT